MAALPESPIFPRSDRFDCRTAQEDQVSPIQYVLVRTADEGFKVFKADLREYPKEVMEIFEPKGPCEFLPRVFGVIKPEDLSDMLAKANTPDSPLMIVEHSNEEGASQHIFVLVFDNVRFSVDALKTRFLLLPAPYWDIKTRGPTLRQGIERHRIFSVASRDEARAAVLHYLELLSLWDDSRIANVRHLGLLSPEEEKFAAELLEQKTRGLEEEEKKEADDAWDADERFIEAVMEGPASDIVNKVVALLFSKHGRLPPVLVLHLLLWTVVKPPSREFRLHTLSFGFDVWKSACVKLPPLARRARDKFPEAEDPLAAAQFLAYVCAEFPFVKGFREGTGNFLDAIVDPHRWSHIETRNFLLTACEVCGWGKQVIPYSRTTHKDSLGIAILESEASMKTARNVVAVVASYYGHLRWQVNPTQQSSAVWAQLLEVDRWGVSEGDPNEFPKAQISRIGQVASMFDTLRTLNLKDALTTSAQQSFAAVLLSNLFGEDMTQIIFPDTPQERMEGVTNLWPNDQELPWMREVLLQGTNEVQQDDDLPLDTDTLRVRLTT